jgi:arylsulfatase A-like enzyme
MIYLLLLALAFYTTASADQTVLSSPYQKVILVSVDTLRADFLGCYNPKMKTTPKLDQFAHQNILCRNVTSQSATTAPSHKSIFYSVYPSIHKTSIRQVPRETGASPMETIRSQGFKTAAFTGGGQLSRSFGFSRGFDSYWEPKTNSSIKHQLKEMENLTFDWLEKNSKTNFFLFLHTYEVHCPYDPPPMFFQKWAGWYKGRVEKDSCYPNAYVHRPLPVDYEYIRDLYAAEVNYVDNFLGQLFQKLRTLGIYDETLIVFLSDHGESLGEHGYVGHNRLYQVQLRVPLILHIPGVAGKQIDAPIESLDVMPTIFELLGIKSQTVPFQGRSLIPLIRNEVKADESRPLISEELGRVRVRVGNLALIFAPDGTTHEELYDLKLDPLELHNLATENAKTVEEMKLPYYRMMEKSKNLSAQFVLDPQTKQDWSEETREQLKALGYIAP